MESCVENNKMSGQYMEINVNFFTIVKRERTVWYVFLCKNQKVFATIKMNFINSFSLTKYWGVCVCNMCVVTWIDNKE